MLLEAKLALVLPRTFFALAIRFVLAEAPVVVFAQLLTLGVYIFQPRILFVLAWLDFLAFFALVRLGPSHRCRWVVTYACVEL